MCIVKLLKSNQIDIIENKIAIIIYYMHGARTIARFTFYYGNCKWSFVSLQSFDIYFASSRRLFFLFAGNILAIVFVWKNACCLMSEIDIVGLSESFSAN